MQPGDGMTHQNKWGRRSLLNRLPTPIAVPSWKHLSCTPGVHMHLEVIDGVYSAGFRKRSAEVLESPPVISPCATEYG